MQSSINSEPVFEQNLEKKGRGKGLLGAFAKPWSTRTIKLRGYTLRYYDGPVLKGHMGVRGCTVEAMDCKDADNKPFAFVVRTLKDGNMVLNASSAAVRDELASFLKFEVTIMDQSDDASHNVA